MHRALIIEDEAPARADLRAKLGAHPEIAVVGEAATFRAARELLARDDYDLVFLDIQLVGGNAFDLVPDVRPGARIVFATAHDRYAIRAFEINALDYLLKPVAPVRLAETLGRLPVDAEAATPGGVLRLEDRVFLRAGLRGRFTRVADICVVTAQDNYSEVFLADGAKVIVRKSLRAWEESLPLPPFARAHRTHLVNLRHVTRYERDTDEHTLLFLEGVAAPVAVSRDRWPELRERLAELHGH